MGAIGNTTNKFNDAINTAANSLTDADCIVVLERAIADASTLLASKRASVAAAEAQADAEAKAAADAVAAMAGTSES